MVYDEKLIGMLGLVAVLLGMSFVFAFLVHWQLRRAEHLGLQPSTACSTEHFDGMRFLCALLIVFVHYCPLASDEYLIVRRLATSSVIYFIMLSGYMTTLAYKREMLAICSARDLATFYVRRIGRFLPLYYFSVLLAILSQGLPTSTQQAAFSIFLLDTWRGIWPAYNGPSWTLSVLFFCWFLAPWLTWALKCVRGRLRARTYVLGIAYAVLPLLFSARAAFDLFSGAGSTYRIVYPPLGVFPFFAGMCLAEVAALLPFDAQDTTRARLVWPFVADAALVIFVLCAILWKRSGSEVGVLWETSLFPPAGAIYILFSQWGPRSPLTRMMAHKTMTAWGAYALHIYLLQDPIAKVVEKYRKENFGVVLALILVGSVFVAEWLDKPWAQYLKMKTARYDPMKSNYTRSVLYQIESA
eukprot:GEMP01015626.1.p1 GENE.GEMP01015626.1~~GEMP01015626.1.p1  ORF type:complete len:413 (+),score=79.17 GEMP01015626.1:399-1637(+)